MSAQHRRHLMSAVELHTVFLKQGEDLSGCERLLSVGLGEDRSDTLELAPTYAHVHTQHSHLLSYPSDIRRTVKGRESPASDRVNPSSVVGRSFDTESHGRVMFARKLPFLAVLVDERSHVELEHLCLEL